MEQLLRDDDDASEHIQEDQNAEDAIYDIKQGEYEINSHFKLRKQVYENALAQGMTKQRALIVSNAFQNHYYMGWAYPKEVMESIDKCWPEGVKKK